MKQDNTPQEEVPATGSFGAKTRAKGTGLNPVKVPTTPPPEKAEAQGKKKKKCPTKRLELLLSEHWNIRKIDENCWIDFPLPTEEVAKLRKTEAQLFLPSTALSASVDSRHRFAEGREYEVLSAIHDAVEKCVISVYYDIFDRRYHIVPGCLPSENLSEFGRIRDNLIAEKGLDTPNPSHLQTLLSMSPLNKMRERCAFVSKDVVSAFTEKEMKFLVSSGYNPEKILTDIKRPNFTRNSVVEAIEMYAQMEKVNSAEKFMKETCHTKYTNAVKANGGVKIDYFAQAAEISFKGNCEEYDSMGAIGVEYCRQIVQCLYRAFVARGCVNSPEGVDFPMMVALESGTQGWGKSDWVKALLPSRYYTDTILIGKDPKDLIPCLGGVLVVEASEMTHISNKKKQEIKQFLSQRNLRAREVWQRSVTVSPMRAVFIGTGNELDYHSDGSGGRRHAPLRLTDKIKESANDWIIQHRDLLLGQAYDELKELLDLYDHNITTLDALRGNAGADQLKGVDANFKKLRATLNLDEFFGEGEEKKSLWKFREMRVAHRSIETEITDVARVLSYSGLRDWIGEIVPDGDKGEWRLVKKLEAKKFIEIESATIPTRPSTVSLGTIEMSTEAALGWKYEYFHARGHKHTGCKVYKIPIRGEYGEEDSEEEKAEIAKLSDSEQKALEKSRERVAAEKLAEDEERRKIWDSLMKVREELGVGNTDEWEVGKVHRDKGSRELH